MMELHRRSRQPGNAGSSHNNGVLLRLCRSLVLLLCRPASLVHFLLYLELRSIKLFVKTSLPGAVHFLDDRRPPTPSGLAATSNHQARCRHPHPRPKRERHPRQETPRHMTNYDNRLALCRRNGGSWVSSKASMFRGGPPRIRIPSLYLRGTLQKEKMILQLYQFL